jgi:hypothetical protein
MKTTLGILRCLVWYCLIYVGANHDWRKWVVAGIAAVILESVRDTIQHEARNA